MLTNNQLTCTLSEVPKSTCALTDFNCVCTNKPLNDALMVCLQAGCTVIEQLTTQRVVQTMCGAPVRDMSTEITAIIWAFFGAAAVAVLMRIIGRLPMLGGEFSWDDYTIFACMVSSPLFCICMATHSHGEACIDTMLGNRTIDGESRLGSGYLDAHARCNLEHTLCKSLQKPDSVAVVTSLIESVLLH